MGKKWDSSGIAYNITVWQECLRVLKPRNVQQLDRRPPRPVLHDLVGVPVAARHLNDAAPRPSDTLR